jgi:hypothetical protein
MRYGLLASVLLLAAVLAGGCGGDANREATRVPQVEGERLDVAQEILDDAGLGYEVIGGGAAGVIVRSNWEVCSQRPPAGRRAESVDLVVARSCGYSDDYDFDDDDFDDDDDWDDDDDF